MTIICYRKRKKQFVPEELKNNKYWAKRSKNNEAAKRSREARRLKENQIAMRARFLEEENLSLKVIFYFYNLCWIHLCETAEKYKT